jgi:hypothetical protein
VKPDNFPSCERDAPLLFALIVFYPIWTCIAASS